MNENTTPAIDVTQHKIDLDKATRELHELSEAHEALSSQWRELLTALEQEHESLLKSILSLKEGVKEQQERVKTLGFELFNATGEKDQGAVEVKGFKTFDIDEAEALRWCEQNMPRLVIRTVNMKVYEKIKRETVNTPTLLEEFGDMPGELVIVNKPTLKRNLTPYINGETQNE